MSLSERGTPNLVPFFHDAEHQPLLRKTSIGVGSGGAGPSQNEGQDSRSASLDEERALVPDNESEEGEVEKSTKSIIGVISVLLLGVFIANADGSFVLATYGVIASEFNALEDSSWLVTVYSLAICATLPIYGKLSDIYGRKAMLITAYMLFAIGCALCGIGPAMWVVILGRVVSGAGGAGMTALVSILITDMVPLRQVASWRSYVNIAATTGRSLGGPLGGLLADAIGWRWSFLVQCPLALFNIACVLWRIKSDNNASKGDDDAKAPSLRRVDFSGSLLIALSITTLLIALDLGGQKFSWAHPLVWGLLVGSAVLGGLFLLVEARWAREPIFPPFLMVHRDVVTNYLVSGFQSAAQLAVMFTVPLYFQVTRRASTASAGAHLFPAVAGNAVGGLLSGFIISRSGHYKAMTLAGCLVAAGGYLLLILFWQGSGTQDTITSKILESLYIFPGGFGMGIIQATTFIGLSAGVEKSQIAVAGTGLYLSSNVGSVVGLSAAASILQVNLKIQLTRHLKGEGIEKIISRAVSDVEYVKRLPLGRVRDIIVAAYVQSLEYTHYASLACAVLAFLVALAMREHDL